VKDLACPTYRHTITLHTATYPRQSNARKAGCLSDQEYQSVTSAVITHPDNMELTDSTTAPFYIVPNERVVSIEHPCIVRNFDNGIKSLGGEPQMKHVSGDEV
jgi:hypothetical protein